MKYNPSEIISKILQSINEKRRVGFDYLDKYRKVKPQGLKYFDNKWYLAGEENGSLKTFNLDQIHNTAWTEGCKAGYNSKEHLALTSSFEYSGPFTETVLMGNLGLRSRMLIKKDVRGRNIFYGRKKLQWDVPNMKITNFEEANKFVTKSYHNGWSNPV